MHQIGQYFVPNCTDTKKNEVIEALLQLKI